MQVDPEHVPLLTSAWVFLLVISLVGIGTLNHFANK